MKKDKFMKSTVAMLAAMSLVSSVAFAAVGVDDNSEGKVGNGAVVNVVDQSQEKDQAAVAIPDKGAMVNVIKAATGYTPKTGTDAAGRTVDASTGASILVTDSTTAVDKTNYPIKEHLNTAKVIVTGERTEMGLGAQGAPTGTAMGAYTVAKAYSSAYGDGAHANAVNSAALGAGTDVDATATGSVAVGYQAKVTENATNSVALGAGSVADKANTVSFGSVDQQRTLSNVADGDLSAGSHDVVTGGQLFQTNQALTQTNSRVQYLGKEVDSVGALSAALAGLHPLDYNGNGSKFSVATAVGNYDGKKALALGGFYNFNPDAMMSVGASMSFGEKKYAENLGFSFRVGQGASAPEGHHDEMAQRFVAMEQAIADLKAQNEALVQNVAAVQQENKDLKAKVDALQK